MAATPDRDGFARLRGRQTARLITPRSQVQSCPRY